MKRHNNSMFNPSTKLLFETYWTNVKRKHGNSPLAIHRNSPSRTRAIELIRDTIRPINDCLGWFTTDFSRLDSFILVSQIGFVYPQRPHSLLLWTDDEFMTNEAAPSGGRRLVSNAHHGNWSLYVCLFVLPQLVSLCYHSCFLNKNRVIIQKNFFNFFCFFKKKKNETPYYLNMIWL